MNLKKKDILKVGDFYFKCCIGKLGLTNKKIEGDKKTPIGVFKIGSVYYRQDRIKKPLTSLKCIKIKKNMKWCNDIKTPKKYNRLFKTSDNFRHEKLMRRDNKYDLLIPIKYNFDKPVVRKGSCIFIHLTKNYRPTAGCIALKKNDFLIMLKLLKKNTKIVTKIN